MSQPCRLHLPAWLLLVSSPRSYTRQLLHKPTFTPASFYTNTLLHQALFAKFTPSSFYTNPLLHELAFPQTTFYTNQLLHKRAFTRISLYANIANQLFDQPAFTQTTFCTNQLLQTSFYTNQLLHKPALHKPTFRQATFYYMQMQTTFYTNQLYTTPALGLLAKGQRAGGMPKALKYMSKHTSMYIHVYPGGIFYRLHNMVKICQHCGFATVTGCFLSAKCDHEKHPLLLAWATLPAFSL